MASGALNSAESNLGKAMWPQSAIYKETYKAGPLLGMMPKDERMGERIRNLVVGTSNPQGAGPELSIAKQNKSPSKAKVFAFSPVKYYSTFSIENLLQEQSDIAGSTVVDVYVNESEGALQTWNRDMSAFLFGNGGGAIGVIGTISANTIKLVDPLTARFFSEGMKVTLATTDGTSGAIMSGTPLEITGIEDDDTTDAGTLTFTTAVALNYPLAAAGNFLFRAGVFGNVINGLRAWVPKFKPGTNGVPGSFLNVDRTLNSRKYAGFRIQCQGLTFYEAGMKALVKMTSASVTPETWVMNVNDWNVFRSQLEGAGNLIKTTAPAAPIGSFKPGIDYDAIEIQGPRGKVKVVADPDCDSGISYMLTLKTWKIASVKAMVRLIDSGRTEEDSDSKESRFAGYLNLQCEAPGHNAVLLHV